MKRKPDPHALRPYGLEYYTHLVHKNPARKGYCMNPVNARVAAASHLMRGEFVKVVCVKRESGRVLWTLIYIGKHIILQQGDLPNKPVKLTLDVPSLFGSGF